ncbi:hypothetical protein TNCV_815741 [Trichonephila clavipes]|nr:hypothetical protein TNCV_815741 [Trichonephila clavipes]
MTPKPKVSANYSEGRDGENDLEEKLFSLPLRGEIVTNSFRMDVAESRNECILVRKGCEGTKRQRASP